MQTAPDTVCDGFFNGGLLRGRTLCNGTHVSHEAVLDSVYGAAFVVNLYALGLFDELHFITPRQPL